MGGFAEVNLKTKLCLTSLYKDFNYQRQKLGYKYHRKCIFSSFVYPLFLEQLPNAFCIAVYFNIFDFGYSFKIEHIWKNTHTYQ